jgi:hypothetical protein
MDDLKQLRATFQLVRFVGKLAKGISAARADGKLNFKDIPHLLPVIPTVLPAFTDADEAVGELLNLSDGQNAQLIELVAEEFDWELNDESRKAIIALIEVAGRIAYLVHFFDNRNKNEPLQ